ncbi:hypothetical protein WN943_001870 [Citrus x changshan-huyou]
MSMMATMYTPLLFDFGYSDNKDIAYHARLAKWEFALLYISLPELYGLNQLRPLCEIDISRITLTGKADIFGGFKDDRGKFKVSLINDLTGMLSLYEAAHLRIRGEDILDEAVAFTTSHLESMVTQVSPQLSDEILHALNRPIRRGLPRLEAIYYIDLYSQDDSKDKAILLKFAKLDFSMLQVIHRKELSIITEWWKILDVEINLPYARNRVVECYFWAMGVYFEPRYSFARKILSKVIAMASILDDTYDAYGTLEELELFTNAIKRWDISNIDVLPKYIKLIYQELLDVFGEAEEQISKEGRTYCMSYVIQAVKKVVQAYFEEAKWCNEGYFPKVEEYMQVSLVTTCYHMLATASFLGMGKIADKLAFERISNYPEIVKASEVICRLMDDIVSHEFEQKRKHVASGIECYMKQHGVSDEEDDDGYTNSYVIKDYITTLLEKPVPF